MCGVPSLAAGGGWGFTAEWYQSLGLGVSRKILVLKCIYIVLCLPNADVLVLYID